MTNTTKKLSEIFAAHENLSLRKIAQTTAVNYNMLLKAGKQPKAGEVYNPDLLNYDAIEAYLRKKLKEQYDSLNWEEIAESSMKPLVTAKPEYTAGSRLKIRQDDNVYKVMIVTETHVCIMAENGTQPRVFSWATFEHQGPKMMPAEEPAKATTRKKKEEV